MPGSVHLTAELSRELLGDGKPKSHRSVAPVLTHWWQVGNQGPVTRKRPQDQNQGENRHSKCQRELQVRERQEGRKEQTKGKGKRKNTKQRKAKAAATDEQSAHVRCGPPALLTGPEDPRSVFSEHGRLFLPSLPTPYKEAPAGLGDKRGAGAAGSH